MNIVGANARNLHRPTLTLSACTYTCYAIAGVYFVGGESSVLARQTKANTTAVLYLACSGAPKEYTTAEADQINIIDQS